jgi:hypothetical protein
MLIGRRDALLTSIFGASGIGLRALATGLPAWFIANPRSATAQTLDCAIMAKEKLQYLILSTSSAGDPINCNVPGTYEAPAIIHPTQATMVPTMVNVGGKVYGAARPWASTDVGGALAPATLTRTAFLHHSTRSTVHGDQPKVMKLLGAMQGGEMVVSAFAKHLAGCLGTVQPEPLAVGAKGNSSELVSYAGRTLPSVSPTQLKQLLTGSKTDPLVKLRNLRDQTVDQLNAMAKADSTNVQKQFLDAMALSQVQVRKLVEQLATTLDAIAADDPRGQALAAAALISANVTPVVTMKIPFGADNHTDTDLANEAAQHVTGVQAIQQVQDALASLGLTDKVTFATLNVFGRNLNGIPKTDNRTGRDHYGNHAVTVMIGKNVAPGVYGGVTQGSSAAYLASSIDSTTGAPSPTGDISVAETHVSAMRTLGVALGIPEDKLASSFTTAGGGKVVRAAVTGV